MFLLITYDVNTEDSNGKRRLRKVAKKCVDYGQRVQNSVFECNLNPAQYRLLLANLLELIDTEKDSLRIYHLGKTAEQRTEHYGAKQTYQTEGFLSI